MTRYLKPMIIAIGTSCLLAACAGPHGEKPVLNQAVERPSSAPYAFGGGYVGATGGGFR
ncbi:hypothetical protein [Lichenifustis flavocetrariae]|uniref:Lipoprotein n=1 Tax=Lichenifustis flavocetrariae TaxID=2949735 RepID=A0AA42CLM2_9HYPH|nr:hypothetical protein [Lichenifustis flavocetrariae]MCW6510561.1 hypothetical protein [Lichenifustis flavocetrariae]